MSEKKFWHSHMKPNLRYKCDIQRIETKLNPGVPDVEGCCNGNAFWVELKYLPKRPPRANLVPRKMESAQTAWLQRRRDNGGRAWVLFQVGDEIFILDGKYSQEILTLKNKTREESHEFWEKKSTLWLPKKPWDWDLILKTLTS